MPGSLPALERLSWELVKASAAGTATTDSSSGCRERTAKRELFPPERFTQSRSRSACEAWVDAEWRSSRSVPPGLAVLITKPVVVYSATWSMTARKLEQRHRQRQRFTLDGLASDSACLRLERRTIR